MRAAFAVACWIGFFAHGVGAEGQLQVRAVDGVRVSYEVTGTEDATIILVHGWSNNRSFWQPHTQVLAKTHRVVAIDLPGFGASGAARDDWSMQKYGEDVVAVANAVGSKRLVLVGFSMGGAAVLEAAKLMPDRLLGVVLVDILQNPNQKYPREMPAQIEAAWTRSWRDTAFVRGGVLSATAPDALVQRYLDNTPEAVPAHWWKIFQRFFGWINDDLLTVLAGQRKPIHAINSDHTPTDVRAWRAHVPSFELSLMPGMGHLEVLWRQPEQFETLLLQAIEKFERRQDVP